MELRFGDPGMTRTCDLRFRKPSLYPAELRDRSPAGRSGHLKAPYQSGRLIASLRSEPITQGASRYPHGHVVVVCSRTKEFIPERRGGPGMPEPMHGIQIEPNSSAKSNSSWSAI